MKNPVRSKYFAIALAIFASFSVSGSFVSAQRKFVRVTFETGIYRDWDEAWMTTAPEDVIATITTGRGVTSKSPNGKNIVVFNNVPCGETIKINIRFVGTAGYSSNSRDFTRKISCRKPVVNLGRLEYGKW